MSYEKGFKEVVKDLREQIALTEQSSKAIMMKLGSLIIESEALKIDSFLHRLEEERKILAQSRGLQSLAKSEDKLMVTVSTIAGAIIGGLGTRSGYGLLGGGLGAFNKALQGSGERGVRWAVGFENQIKVIPLAQNQPLPKGIWVTWESLRTVALGLKQCVLAGVGLGNVDSFLSKLKHERKLSHFAQKLPVGRCDCRRA